VVLRRHLRAAARRRGGRRRRPRDLRRSPAGDSERLHLLRLGRAARAVGPDAARVRHAATVERHPDDLTSVRLSLARWVPCTERPDLCVGEYPVEGTRTRGWRSTRLPHRTDGPDRRARRHQQPRPRAVLGRWAGAGGDLGHPRRTRRLRHPAHRRARPALRGLGGAAPRRGHPGRARRRAVGGRRGRPWPPLRHLPAGRPLLRPEATFVAFRGPFGFPIELTEVIGRRENPARGSMSRTSTERDVRTSGLDDLHAGELRMRDGRPILHLESGTPTWG
jgi:hypothetical protein